MLFYSLLKIGLLLLGLWLIFGYKNQTKGSHKRDWEKSGIGSNDPNVDEFDE